MNIENKEGLDFFISMLRHYRLEPLYVQIKSFQMINEKTADSCLEKYEEISSELDELEKKEKLADFIELNEKVDTIIFKISGLEKITVENIKVFSMLDDLEKHCDELTFKDYEKMINELELKISLIETLKSEEIDEVNNRFYGILARYVNRARNENKDLRKILEKRHKVGLEKYLISFINNLNETNRKSDKDKAIILKEICSKNSEFVYSNKFWSIFYDDIRECNQEEPKNNELALIKADKNLSFINRVKRLFLREPTLPLNYRMLRNIDIEWLSKSINKQTLENIERRRLFHEGKRVKDIFIYDKKTPIYNFIQNNLNLSQEDDYIYEYIDNNGIKKRLEISLNFDEETCCFKSGTEFYEIITADSEARIISILEYARYLDKSFKSDFLREIVCEFENYTKKEDDVYILFSAINKKCKKFHTLYKSFKKLVDEYNRTNFDFRGKEEQRREEFYKEQSLNSGFIENLKREDKRRKKKPKKGKKNKEGKTENKRFLADDRKDER